MAGTGDFRRAVATGLVALITLALPAVAEAADGDLDPSFAGDGTAEHDFSPGNVAEGAGAVLFDAQGRILVAGNAFGLGFGLGRYLADGSPDPAYGSGGFNYYNIPTRSPMFDAAMLGGERLALGGLIDGATFDAFGAVIDGAGALDPSWGNDPPNPVGDGVVRLSATATSEDVVTGVGADSQGRTVLAGRTGTNMVGGANDVFVARFGTDGAPDASFSGGLVVRNLGTDDKGYDVLALADGKLLVLALTDTQYVLLRLNADGSPDASFGTDGVLQIPGFTSTDSESGQLALAPDGSVIVLATLGTYPNWTTGLARLAATGTLDSGFGQGGATIIDAGQRAFPAGVAVGDDGRIVYGLTVRTGTIDNATVRRLTPSGNPDSGFGNGGTVTLADNTGVSSIAIGADRRIILGGTAYPAAPNDGAFLVARLLGDTVAPDTAITKAKKKLRSGAKAKLEFAAVGDVNTTFECALKKPRAKRRREAKPPAFASCSSPMKTKRLKRPGKYRFLVRAIDPAGNVDASPATKKLKVKPKRR